MEERIEMGQMYETVLASPGMNQTVRLSFSVSRKSALLLNQLIEKGVAGKGRHEKNGIIAFMPVECFQQMEVVSMELLRKADLVELNDKLNAIASRP